MLRGRGMRLRRQGRRKSIVWMGMVMIESVTDPYDKEGDLNAI